MAEEKASCPRYMHCSFPNDDSGCGETAEERHVYSEVSPTGVNEASSRVSVARLAAREPLLGARSEASPPASTGLAWRGRPRWLAAGRGGRRGRRAGRARRGEEAERRAGAGSGWPAGWRPEDARRALSRMQASPEPAGDARCRGREAAEAERLRTRERLEATLAGLAELELLRQRQRLRVRRLLLGASGEQPPADAPRSPQEKLLEENILLLRRQLNCLRRRDAGLLNQLQELDKQISDLRLDVEKTADEHLETDSRPSSGFYELSDGASGSLSNSSNSVFSECLSSCHSSTCFCSPLDVSLNSCDGRPKSADLVGWLECNKGSQHEDQSMGIVSHSVSTPHSNSLDVVPEVHPKYQCDLVSKNGNDVYRYPSPLHAVAVQSPMFLLPVMENAPREEEERVSSSVGDVCIGPELDPVKTSTSCSLHNLHSSPCPTANRKIDSYILSLVQKKTPSVRTNKPRTNLNADPAKGILRHGSICARQMAGVTQNSGLNLKNSGQAFPHSSGTTLDHGALSPAKQHMKETEHLETKKMLLPIITPPNASSELQNKHSTRSVKTQEATRCPVVSKNGGPKDSGRTFVACPKESSCEHATPPKESKAAQLPQKMLFKNSGLQATCAASPPPETRPPLDFKSEGLSSQSLEEGLLVNAQYIPAQPQTVRLHKGTKSMKILKSSMVKHRSHLVTVLENGPQAGREKGKSTGKKCRFPDDLDTNKKPKKATSRGKKSSHVQPETSLLSRPPGALRSMVRPHGHGREAVVAKPKHKRADYRRWKLSAEVSYEEALRRAKRHRREALGVYPQVPHPYISPYAYVASDSEYSAECESLFHSTVVDTSEDEKSNYTTNCFGDSESSLSEVEFVGESTTTSDSDESGGLLWSQFVQTLPIQTVAASSELHENAGKAFVKIKASHNLKKKILRFRSGSLKLMTTV
ncbi:dapper homolog 1 [Tiliqua scincoides]|uniref:dapper homolog 1 n=1 Tax=Tiliqua scincoides TaxID=71010 RepID=UPI0034620E07